MKKILLALLFLLLCCFDAAAKDIKITWDPNAESDLAGYKVYSGETTGVYDTVNDVGNQTTYEITDLKEGQQIFIAATAYDLSGNESDYSDELFYVVPYSLDARNLIGETIDSINPDKVNNLRGTK